MKRGLSALAMWLFVTGSVHGQNIIYNGSFEEFTVLCCASANGQMCALPWSSSSGSPDHFRSCGEGLYTVPINYGGQQEPRSGSAYAGFITVALPTLVNHREFLAQQIRYELQAGEPYYFECWVSPMDHLRRVCHNIGVSFTLEGVLLDCIPHCDIYFENDSLNPLDDKEVWTKVSGTFFANGGEDWIHIGNFRPDSLSEMEWVDDGSNDTLDWWDSPYYYIDDVWLSHVDSMHYVGVEDQLAMDNGPLTVYPNPASELVSIKLQGLKRKPVRLIVYDAMGREIVKLGFDSAQPDNTVEIDVGSFPNGLYIVEVMANNGNTLRSKFLVE